MGEFVLLLRDGEASETDDVEAGPWEALERLGWGFLLCALCLP